MFQPQANTAPVELSARPWYKPPATAVTFTATDVSRFKPALAAPDAGATTKPSNTMTITSPHVGVRKKPLQIPTRKLERSSPPDAMSAENIITGLAMQRLARHASRNSSTSSEPHSLS